MYLVSSRCEVLCLDSKGMADGNDGPFKDEAKYVVQDVILDKGKPTERPAPPIQPGPKDADIIWRYDMINELGVFPHNASDGAPLIVGDLVYVNTSNGQDWTHSNIPSPNAPSLIALNKRTGEFVAEDDAKIGPRIFHGLWSSPSTGSVNGRQLIFYGGGDGVCYAFDPKPVKEGDSTYLKKVWWYDCNPPERKRFKYPDAKAPAKSTPRRSSGRTASIPPSARTRSMAKASASLPALTPPRPGTSHRPGRFGRTTRSHRSLSTASITPDGLLFIGDFSGFLHCLDAETGQALLDARHEGAHVGLDAGRRRQGLCRRRRRGLCGLRGQQGEEDPEHDQSRGADLLDPGGRERRPLRLLEHAPVRLPRYAAKPWRA